jgi:25S rRNA (adenine2142-N1)-methyltransferase
MPKSRQRKIPVTSHSGPSSQSGTHTESGRSSHPASTQTRAIIRRFHVLLKKRAQLGDSTSGENAAQLAAVEREMEELGGLDAYQRMSIAGQSIQRGGGSESIFITWLRELGVDCQYNSKGKGKAMKGAETQLFQ